MEFTAHNSEQQSQGEYDSIPTNSLNSIDTKRQKKAKKYIKVEKVGDNEEYDQSLLKRRK